MRISKLIITLLLFIGNGLLAQNPNLGTVGAQFLKLPPTARAIGMGGAFVGTVNDVSAIFWNPAGLTGLGQNTIQYSSQNQSWMEYFNLNSLSLARRVGRSGVLAAGVIVFSMDEMAITSESQPNGTGQEFDAQDLALSLSYAQQLTNRFSVGLTGKYIRQRIWNEVARGVCFDIGTQYNIPFKNLTLAMSMTNFGPDMKFDGPDLDITHDGDPNFPNRIIPARKTTAAYPLPLNFTFGVAMDLFSSRQLNIRSELDAIHPNDNDERLQFGTEIRVINLFTIRGGYRWMTDQERIDNNISLGFGLNTPFSSYNISVDIAYMMNEYLPDVILYTVGIDL